MRLHPQHMWGEYCQGSHCRNKLIPITRCHAKRSTYSLPILIVSFAVLPLPVFVQEVIATVPVGSRPDTQAINLVTNKIYVANTCGNDFGRSCAFPYSPGKVSVIDGGTNNTLPTNVGYLPYGVAVNSVTNKIYVAVIDGVTNNPVSVNVAVHPYGLDVNLATNKIYVANQRGDFPKCGSTATMTVIDGATLATSEIAIVTRFTFQAIASAILPARGPAAGV
jgi:hypothetical protein